MNLCLVLFANFFSINACCHHLWSIHSNILPIITSFGTSLDSGWIISDELCWNWIKSRHTKICTTLIVVILVFSLFLAIWLDMTSKNILLMIHQTDKCYHPPVTSMDLCFEMKFKSQFNETPSKRSVESRLHYTKWTKSLI